MKTTLAKKSMAVPKHLIDRYWTNEYTFNEYPHKSLWSTESGESGFKTALRNLASSDEDASQLLFINIPFCERQCLFCICHTIITSDYERIRRYLQSLLCEIDLFREFCDGNLVVPGIGEIHIGGGTPTILVEEDFDRLIEKVRSIADMDGLSQFSIEIDPRCVTTEDLQYYRALGVDRISLGIQDFDLDVQKAINRVQPVELVENLLTPQMRECFDGVNFDVLCGLPRQTMESFRRTIEKVIELSPDRIMLMFLNYSPDLKKHHRLMNESEMPGLYEKIAIFSQAVRMLVESGYVRIGFDHFAKPTDDLARAMQDRAMHWNSLGYRPGRCIDMIGLGAGSLSRITAGYYSQNALSLSDYEAAVAGGRFPVMRGHKLTSDDVLRRDVIHELRCYFSLDIGRIEEKYDIDFRQYFAAEVRALGECASDGILEMSEDTIILTELGEHFVAHICGIFDAYMPQT